MAKKRHEEFKKATGMDNMPTAQDIMKMPEEKWMVHGARMVCRELYGYIENNKDMGKQTIVNLINFLGNKCKRDEIETFMYGLLGGISLKQDEKRKSVFEPVKIFCSGGKREHGVNPNEFVTADEQKYRTLCEVLLDALDNTAQTIAMMSGRDRKDVLNQLVLGVNEKTGRSGWKTEVVKDGVEE